MKRKKIAEPDFDYKIETLKAEEVNDRVFFETELIILKATSGKATITINTEQHIFNAGTNFLLSDGISLKFISCSDDFEMIIIRFSSNFLNEIYPVLEDKIFDVIIYSAPDLYSTEDAKMSDLIIQQLCTLHSKQNHTFKSKIAINLSLNYTYEIYELTRHKTENKTIDCSYRKRSLINQFHGLCSENYSKHRNIEFYAAKLNITSRYLYKICKESVMMTPKESINYFIIGEIKKLLRTTDMTLQQISFQLNFPDQATFGQYFKRNVNMSPSEYRKKYK